MKPAPPSDSLLPAVPRRTLWTMIGLYLLAQVLFLINIQFPRTLDFDEFHYVPSAKQMLELRENQNYEHPPLGKEIMAVSIAVFGDRPIGWRFASTFFGALTLVAMFLWALAIFSDERTALWVALITLVNQLLYVQSRIGMLDTFMMTFLAGAMAAFSATWIPDLSARRLRACFYAAGTLLGFAIACKWFAIIPLAVCLGLVFLVKVLQDWGTRFEDPQPTDWYRPSLWSEMRGIDWALAFLVLPFVAYFVTFIPLFFTNAPGYGPQYFFTMQWRMWDGQSRVVSPHPYMSTWTDWAFLKRPIWYAFDKEGAGEFVRGVLLLGNPLIMWGGLVALFACAWGWLVQRRRDAFLIFVTYAAFYLSWAVIPRKVSFYYYYYPAGMVLSLALAYALRPRDQASNEKAAPATSERLPVGGSAGPWSPPAAIRWAFLGAATALFIYFFPILAALRITSDSFRHWMWFSSWI